MYKIGFIIFCSLLFASTATAKSTKDQPGQLIRVGVFPNPPVAFKDETGKWRGISIDVLEAIAKIKGWQLQFVQGSFSQHLKKLETHEVDILSMMAYSDARAKKYSFSRHPLISNWGIVYSKGSNYIASLLDLEGKRVAVMKNNIHDTAFRKQATKFGLSYTRVDRPNFRDVMQSIQKGDADAGVVNRLFGSLNAHEYNLVETGIIFNPINIHYSALNPDYEVILSAIDEHLSQFKSNKDSIYYSSIERWMHKPKDETLPSWLAWVALGLVSIIILMVGISLLLRKQVAVRTIELQREVDERRQAQIKLDNLAYYDSLTQLPNRASLLKFLKAAIKGVQRNNQKIAILFIDIDRFKTVNDSLGHTAGDQLIIQVAKRLQKCLRDEDTICRFGGDEYVAIIHNINSLSDISNVATRMLKSLSAPINIGVTEIYSSVCIGAALFPDDDPHGEHLLKYADAAMYHAKEKGGNNYQFYNTDLTERVNKRLSLETRLRHALDRDEFILHYQPIYNITSQQPIGVETLIRWQDPEAGLISPDEFIPLAEETGLIVPIGEWVLDQACKQVYHWEKQQLGQLLLAVNISSRQFEHNKLYTTVMSALNNSGLMASQLELEITERMFLNITQNVRDTLDRLTQEKVRLSIDDFGTGYSSLSYLKELPIDTLKIDRSFIMGIPDDKDDIQIASTIVSMAHGLGLNVIAEGIETTEQLAFLNTINCNQGQGYFLAHPQSPEEITSLLQSNNNL